MPNQIDVEEGQLRVRVRDAIQAGGKSGVMAKKTGIPVGTLNKYVSLRSTPNALNVLKIAAALGISVEQLAQGDLVPTAAQTFSADLDELETLLGVSSAGSKPRASSVSIDNPTLPLRRSVMREVNAMYRASGLAVSDEDVSVAAMEIFSDLADRVVDFEDAKEVDLVKAQLLHNLDRELRKAVTVPGSGKRSAS